MLSLRDANQDKFVGIVLADDVTDDDDDEDEDEVDEADCVSSTDASTTSTSRHLDTHLSRCVHLRL